MTVKELTRRLAHHMREDRSVADMQVVVPVLDPDDVDALAEPTEYVPLEEPGMYTTEYPMARLVPVYVDGVETEALTEQIMYEPGGEQALILWCM